MKATLLVALSLSLASACDDAPALPADSTTTTTAVAPDTTTPQDTSAPEDTSLEETVADTAIETEADTSVAPDTITEDTSDGTGGECSPASPCSPGFICEEGSCVCDPTPVSFATDVLPMFTTGCGPGCHVFTNAASGSGGLNVHANHAYDDLVDVMASQCTGAKARPRVAPGDPEGSYLMDKLLGRNMCLGVRMPKGRSPFTAVKLATVGRWICQGAADN